MLAIVESMTPAERLYAGATDADGKGTLLEKLGWAHGQATDLCIKGLEVGAVADLLGAPED